MNHTRQSVWMQPGRITVQKPRIHNFIPRPGEKLHEYEVRENPEEFVVHNGTMKFGVRIENWNFCEEYSQTTCKSNTGMKEVGEYLDLYLQVKGGRPHPVRAQQDQSRTTPSYNRRPKSYDFGGGDITFSEQVTSFVVNIFIFVDLLLF